jgi:hypothetical protein
MLLAWAIPALAGYVSASSQVVPTEWSGPDLPGVGVLRIDVLDTINPGARTFLEPNVPNPFEARTRISYSIATAGAVRLRVYDFWHHEVATLVDTELRAGRYHAFFDIALIDPVPYSGMYFYELEFGGETMQRRMLLIK